MTPGWPGSVRTPGGGSTGRPRCAAEQLVQRAALTGRRLGRGFDEQRGEAARALVVVLQEEAVDIELAEQRLGDEVVAALGREGGSVVAPAHVRRDPQVGRPQPGENAAVVGIGGLGHLGLQYAKIFGATTIAIDVEDAPFVAIELISEDVGRGRSLAFRLNTDELVIAGPAHPLRLERGRPYLAVRRGLDALVARPVFYELAEIALAEGGGLWSGGAFFPLGEPA